MKIVECPTELRAALADWQRAGARIGFVPTMGALHEGHLSLVRLASEHSDLVVASVFVNPTQFGPGEDLERYPRTPEADADVLDQAGCDLLYRPSPEALYPPGFGTYIEPAGAARGLEGDHRPGHFRGVATVVTLLFQQVRPDVAVFGEKDAQQLAVIRQVVRDLGLEVEIVAGPTVRAADGLALSSRNCYLDPEDRRAATAVYRALTEARERIAAGEREVAAIRGGLRADLESEPRIRVDYAEVVDATTFRPLRRLAGSIVLPVAIRLGPTRLIDNLRIELPAAPGAPSTLEN